MEDRRFLRFFSLSLCIGLVLHNSDIPHHLLDPISLCEDPSEIKESRNLWDGDTKAYGSENQETPASFAKTLTQYDANNGGGFSVPRYCAETIFPKLDYSADPLVQTKKLVDGDSIVFMRAENGDLCVGIRTAKRGLDGGGGNEVASGWNNSHSSGGGSGGCVLPYGKFCVFVRDEDNKMRNEGGGLSLNGNMRGKGRVRPESVVKAATMAAND
ncbi:unnamed protein product [Malus baccata var. baccata]